MVLMGAMGTSIRAMWEIMMTHVGVSKCWEQRYIDNEYLKFPHFAGLLMNSLVAISF